MNLRNVKKSETTEQILVIQWCKCNECQYPALKWIYHNPNGGKREHNEAAVLKQMGVKAGVPDLNLPIARGRYIGLWIEMKFGDNRTTKEQDKWIEAMKEQGHYVKVCYSAQEACQVIEKYLNLKGMEALV